VNHSQNLSFSDLTMPKLVRPLVKQEKSEAVSSDSGVKKKKDKNIDKAVKKEVVVTPGAQDKKPMIVKEKKEKTKVKKAKNVEEGVADNKENLGSSVEAVKVAGELAQKEPDVAKPVESDQIGEFRKLEIYFSRMSFL
jgi:hypothetical protein